MADFLDGLQGDGHDEDDTEGDGADIMVALPGPAPMPRDCVPPPPSGEALTAAGKKFDAGKAPLHLLFRHNILDAVTEMARVIDFGRGKYGQDNWELVENGRERYLAALVRHVAKYASGETFDEETDLHHLAHAMTNCAFLIFLGNEEVTEDPVVQLVDSGMAFVGRVIALLGR